MVDMIWEYYRKADCTNSCLNCEFYWRHMSSEKYDVQDLMNKNNIKEYERGQKLCIKHKEFVFMSWSCGEFLELPEHNRMLNKKDVLSHLKKYNNTK
jgi:hypothetical protein